MNTLDSPLEVLTFNFLNYGFVTAVNNLWTWVAVITAAISFWRFRASVSLKSDPFGPNPDPSPANVFSPSSPVPDTVVAAEPASNSADSLTTAAAATTGGSFCGVESTDGVRRGKFTVYYEEDDVSEGEGGSGEYDEGGVDGGDWWCENWERTLRLRMGEMGWYRYQDLTMLNGNVVKLWESR